MSKLLYNFIADSFLYQQSDSLWSTHSDKDIIAELFRYRDHAETVGVARPSTSAIRAFAGFEMPPFELIRQTALYLDKIYIYDPLIEILPQQDSYSEALTKFMGFKSTQFVDRQKLQTVINYLKELAPFVEHDFAEIVPISFKPDLSNGVKIFASENEFKELLPDEIREWFHERAIIRSVVKAGDKRVVLKELKLGREIMIRFDGNGDSAGFGYFLIEKEILEVDKANRTYRFMMTLPGTLPEKAHFDSWVEQSINQASNEVFRQIAIENYFCSAMNGTMYLSESEFKTKLLSLQFDRKSGVLDRTANLALNLDLPVIRQISNADLMSVRANHDSAFQNFRSSLEKKVSTLSTVNDRTLLQKKIEEYSYELTETNIRDLEVAMRSVKTQLKLELTLATGSLVTTVLAGGWGVLPAAISAFRGFRTYDEYRGKVATNPSFLLWKMRDRNRKSAKKNATK